MRPGSREWCAASSPHGAKLIRCGAITPTAAGKVADAMAQGAVQTVTQSCWLGLELSRGQSPGVAQPPAMVAIGAQGDIANAATGCSSAASANANDMSIRLSMMSRLLDIRAATPDPSRRGPKLPRARCLDPPAHPPFSPVFGPRRRRPARQ